MGGHKNRDLFIYFNLKTNMAKRWNHNPILAFGVTHAVD
jgi:hypothetical protein